MAIAMFMTWNGVTPEQYEATRALVGWERDLAPGGLFHVAGFDGDTLRIADVWESAEDFQRFVDGRLMPGVAQVGIAGEPEVHIVPVHELFTPGFSRR